MKNLKQIMPALMLFVAMACGKEGGNNGNFQKANTTETYLASNGSGAKTTYSNNGTSATLTIEANGTKYQLDEKAPGKFERNGVSAVQKDDSLIITQGDMIIPLAKVK